MAAGRFQQVKFKTYTSLIQPVRCVPPVVRQGLLASAQALAARKAAMEHNRKIAELQLQQQEQLEQRQREEERHQGLLPVANAPASAAPGDRNGDIALDGGGDSAQAKAVDLEKK